MQCYILEMSDLQQLTANKKSILNFVSVGLLADQDRLGQTKEVS